MARERITFPVNLRQNINDDSTAYGKWFPVPSSSEPMSLKGFAKHLAEHGKLASYDMLVLVLQNIVGSFVICIDYHRAGGMRRWAFSKSSGVSSSMEKRSVVSTMRKVWP